MIQAMAGELALKGRRIIKSGGTGEEHWRTDFLGKRADGTIKDHQPQAFLIEMQANEVIVPHFHEVDQFQVFVSGSGSLGRESNLAHPLAVHYADHHTGYGPINAGPQGYAYFTLLTDLDGSDGLAASMLRMGPGASHAGPDPRAGGGQHFLVLNGSLKLDGNSYSAWSTVFVSKDEAPLDLRAGPKGLEVLLLQFPRA